MLLSLLLVFAWPVSYVAAIVLVCWLRRVLPVMYGSWSHSPPRPSVTATVVRPIPSPRETPGGEGAASVAPRIIRGEVER